MAQLSAQSIERLCQPTRPGLKRKPGFFNNSILKDTVFTKYDNIKIPQTPMIHPFVNEKVVFEGKSYGLSAASYDCRIREDVTLGPNGSETCCALVHTIERFAIPDNVCGYVCDKSSYARVFVGAFNTLFDPGFSGKTKDNENPEDPWADAVLELVNFGRYPVEIKAGSPICQFTFHWLDEPTNRPYRGKYSGQKGAQPAIYERIGPGDLEPGPNLSSLRDDNWDSTPYGQRMLQDIKDGKL